MRLCYTEYMIRRILGIVVGLFVAGLVVVFWFGIPIRGTVGQAFCPQHYTHYVVTPFLRNAWECRNRMPCGTDENLDRYNAKVGVIQCLCRDNTTNHEAIAQYYAQYLSVEQNFSGNFDLSSQQICGATQKLYRF